MTLRVDHEIIKILEQHAKKNNISINSLMNQIFHDYVDWHMQASAGGFIYFKKSLLATLIDKVDEKDIPKLAAEDIESEKKQTLYMLRKKSNLDVAIDVFETWLKASGVEYSKDIDTNNDVYTLAIHLGMNKKSSLLIAEICHYLFESLGANKVEYETTTTMAIVRIFSKMPKSRYFP